MKKIKNIKIDWLLFFTQARLLLENVKVISIGFILIALQGCFQEPPSCNYGTAKGKENGISSATWDATWETVGDNIAYASPGIIIAVILIIGIGMALIKARYSFKASFFNLQANWFKRRALKNASLFSLEQLGDRFSEALVFTRLNSLSSKVAIQLHALEGQKALEVQSDQMAKLAEKIQAEISRLRTGLFHELINRIHKSDLSSQSKIQLYRNLLSTITKKK